MVTCAGRLDLLAEPSIDEVAGWIQHHPYVIGSPDMGRLEDDQMRTEGWLSPGLENHGLMVGKSEGKKRAKLAKANLGGVWIYFL